MQQWQTKEQEVQPYFKALFSKSELISLSEYEISKRESLNTMLLHW